MMLKTLKCRKEGMREKRNVRMSPHTSAQYLHRALPCLTHSFLYLPLFMNAMSSASSVMHACKWCMLSAEQCCDSDRHAPEEGVQKIIVLEQRKKY